LRLISLVFRTVVALNWATVLSILAIHNVPRNLALDAFTVFKITAILGTLWLVVEIAEGFTGRIRIFSVIVDCVLVLLMFGFWFLVAAATF